MRIKLDENIGTRGIELFDSAGHDVSTVVGQGMSSANDRTLAVVCRNEGRCLLSLDLDFSNPLLFKPEDYSGIAVLRLPPKPGPDDLYTCISTLVAGLAKSDINGKLWIVQPRRIREHQPPSVEDQ